MHRIAGVLGFSARIAWVLGLLTLLMAAFVAPRAASAQDSVTVTAPTIEYVEEDEGLWARWTEFLVDFQRRANAEISHHMRAIENGEDMGAFFLGLGIAFLYGMFHAFGPGHGKFVIMSYFLGRDVQVGRGVLMAVQIAVVHVISAIVIVWLADVLLKAGWGIGLSDVPGVRAGSFLIIAAIGIYMLYQAFRGALGYAGADGGHGHSHSHSHGHSHGHSHAHSHGGGKAEGRWEDRLMAFAAGVVPCPGAVLIMLYAIANAMIYPGFMLVAAMSVGIGLTICLLGVGAIMARQTALRLLEGDGSGGGAVVLRHSLNFGGAFLVTLIGLVSFLAFLDVPIG